MIIHEAIQSLFKNKLEIHCNPKEFIGQLRGGEVATGAPNVLEGSPGPPICGKGFPGPPGFPDSRGTYQNITSNRTVPSALGGGPCRISPGASPYENRRLVRFHCSRTSLKRNAHGVEARAPFCSKNRTARRRKHDGTSATDIPTSGGAPKTLVLHRKA